MNIFDNITESLKNALGQPDPNRMPEAMPNTLSETPFGNLGGLIGRLQEGGLSEEVKSWLGNGANLPVSPQQIQSALGNEHIAQIARSLGLPVDAALKFLSEQVPKAVDQASPNGSIPSGGGQSLDDEPVDDDASDEEQPKENTR